MYRTTSLGLVARWRGCPSQRPKGCLLFIPPLFTASHLISISTVVFFSLSCFLLHLFSTFRSRYHHPNLILLFPPSSNYNKSKPYESHRIAHPSVHRISTVHFGVWCVCFVCVVCSRAVIFFFFFRSLTQTKSNSRSAVAPLFPAAAFSYVFFLALCCVDGVFFLCCCLSVCFFLPYIDHRLLS